MLILGIETSCDETAAAVVKGDGDSVQVISNVVSSQIEVHKKYGGVIPEIAAREHVFNIIPVINETLDLAKINHSDLLEAKNKIKIDAIAVTLGPGLITSLLIGVETAKTLAFAWNIPIVAINHIEGHIFANWIKPINEIKDNIKFPILILTVSGGHTLLVLMKDYNNLKIIGETRDDAAGEAFDKAAQLLDIGYPGGPAIAACAAQIKNNELATKKIILPRPMIVDKSFDFSFSGLKTALLYQLKKDTNWQNHLNDYAYEFQQAVIDVLVSKTIRAAQKFNARTVMLSGGVSANLELRKQLEANVIKKLPFTNFCLPGLEYTTDNAAMIASAGYFKVRDKKFISWQKLKPDPNFDL